MSTLLDRQFVVHLFAPADGPAADQAWQAIRDVWNGAAEAFGLTEPLGRLRRLLPQHSAALPDAGEVVLAGQEARGSARQAVLRRHHDVFNLSVGLAVDGDDGLPSVAERWRRWERTWTEVVEPFPAGSLVGEARLYLARMDGAMAPTEGDAVGEAALLYQALDEELPASARAAGGSPPAAAVGDGMLLWEPVSWPDDRELRSLVLAFGAEQDPAASAWAWSAGTPQIPPFARYLLHAAKIRYELRVWQRFDQTDGLRREMAALQDALAKPPIDGGAREESAVRLRGLRREALLAEMDLRALRLTVEIAVDNLERSGARPTSDPGPNARGGPFADDEALARSAVERLDDQLEYLCLSTERAARVLASEPAGVQTGPDDSSAGGPAIRDAPAPDAARSGADADDANRRVFVVHGRDEAVRVAVFELLTALGLNPLEWEDVVRLSGAATPFLGGVLERVMPQAQAILVVLTPDDQVRLHPQLREPGDSAAADRLQMQARPNVLYEAGLAFGINPHRTLLLEIGSYRTISDLEGRNVIRVDDAGAFRYKLAMRLQGAGCPVTADLGDPDAAWRTAGEFASLAARHRGEI